MSDDSKSTFCILSIWCHPLPICLTKSMGVPTVPQARHCLSVSRDNFPQGRWRHPQLRFPFQVWSHSKGTRAGLSLQPPDTSASGHLGLRCLMFLLVVTQSGGTVTCFHTLLVNLHAILSGGFEAGMRLVRLRPPEFPLFPLQKVVRRD